ncbi:hypothetical protein D3C77_693630 [compost metagenome]
MLPHAGADPLAQGVQRAPGTLDTEDRHLQLTVVRQRVQRREYLLVSQIAERTKEHDEIRTQ